MSNEEDFPRHGVVLESEGGLAKACKWTATADKAGCPHKFEVRDHSKGIKDSILDCVGNTPMVRINNITKADNIECEVLVKCEFLNPGGSVKDRIARRMLLGAEADGKLKKDGILIEPTSGNTGMGLAIACAAKGYPLIICMPEKMSQEKQDALMGLGATIVRTPTEFGKDHAHSYMGVAFTMEKTMQEAGKNALILNQYKNPGNPLAHYDETGQEIFDQCGGKGKVDYVILGVGTGGTITGIARKLKELDPNIKVVGIDPPGSILSPPDKQMPAAPGGQVIEGTGYDFHPRVYDKTVVDDWQQGPDKESFIMARRLLSEEGLMCGGSSGQAMFGALQYIKENKIPKGKRVVVVLADNIRNYMTKHLNADWMYERGYMTEKQCANSYLTDLIPNKDWGQNMTVGDLPLHKAQFMCVKTTCQEALNMIRSSGFEQFPVKDGDVTIGMLTDKNLLMRLSKNHVQLGDSIKKVVSKDLRQVSKGVTLNELSRVLTRNSFVLVEDQYFIHISDVLDKISPPKAADKPAEVKPVEAKPAEVKPVEAKPVEVKPVEVKEETNGGWKWMTSGMIVGAGIATLAMKHLKD